MEKEEIKKILAWIQKNPPLSRFLGSLAAGIILLMVSAVIRGVTFKMVYETLINLDLFNVFGVAFLIIAMIFGVLLVKQQWKASIEKKDEEIHNIKSELGERAKQYDELVEKTKIPSEAKIIIIIPDKFLTVDRGEVSSFPTLHFMLGVHNCSYYRFEPTRVELKSYNSGKKVGEDVWDKTADVGYKSAKGYIRLGEQLPKWGGSWIDFVVPIEKRYDVWHSWDLKGYVTYTDGGKNWKVQIETRHHLFEKRSAELERLLEKAL